MSITASQVKELRERTGAGMMECKKALNEVGGNMDEAIEYLRKQGLKASDKKATRTAAEGLVVTASSSDGKVAVLLEANCETDFVAKNEDFVAFTNKVAEHIVQNKPSNVEDVLSADFGGSTVQETLTELVAKIGEKMTLRRFVIEEAQGNESLGYYIHMGSKIGVLLKLSQKPSNDDLVKDVAMHIAAMNPQYLNKDDISPEVIEKEKEIYKQQLLDEGKPENIIEKILGGKVAKFATEICLNEQVFIKDSSGKQKVAQVLKADSPELKILSFTRFQVGEGIEKKDDNFAEEVAKMAN